jgi:hypothetical protein
MTKTRVQLTIFDALQAQELPSLDNQVMLFAKTAERKAESYATGFHAGVAAIRREIGSLLRENLCSTESIRKIANELVKS